MKISDSSIYIATDKTKKSVNGNIENSLFDKEKDKAFKVNKSILQGEEHIFFRVVKSSLIDKNGRRNLATSHELLSRTVSKKSKG